MKQLGLLLAAVALAGCQTVNSTWSSITSPDSSSSGGKPSEAQPAQTAPQVAMVTPTAPASTPGTLKGKTSEALHALWGEPSLKRKDLGSELWQYAGKGCTLLVYLYPSSGAMTVSHAEAVPGGSDEAAIDACAKAAGKPPLKPVS